MRSFPRALRTGAFALGASMFFTIAGCGDDSEVSGTGGGGAGTTTSSTDAASTTTAVTTDTSSAASQGGGSGTSDASSGTGTGGTGGDGTGGDGTGGDGTGGDGTGGGGTGGAGGGPAVWAAPACEQVQGSASITFSTDAGDTLAPRQGSLGGVSYTAGVAALDTPNVLLVAANGTLLRSEDAGCTFTEVGPISTGYTRLVPAPGGRAYGYEEGYLSLFRVDGDAITPLASPGEPGVDGLVGLGVDPRDGDHLRVGLYDGTIWDSTDAGATFAPVGTVPDDGCFYQVVFDPADLDHVLCGTLDTGSWLSVDGGDTWARSKTDVQYSNAFRLAFSPADPNVAWIEGIELDLHEGQPVGTLIRHVWRSVDGGLTFETVILENQELEGDGGPANLFNGNFLAPDPVDPGVLWMTYGMPPLFGENFAELIRLEPDADAFTIERHTGGDIDDYTAITFNPGAPEVVYFALSSERSGG